MKSHVDTYCGGYCGACSIFMKTTSGKIDELVVEFGVQALKRYTWICSQVFKCAVNANEPECCGEKLTMKLSPRLLAILQAIFVPRCNWGAVGEYETRQTVISHISMSQNFWITNRKDRQ